MTQETPAKVMSLLGVALTSMFFLFMVTVTNASFQGAEGTFPDPFAPAKVVAVLDNVAHGYSNFVAANFTQPLKYDVAFYKDNLRWVIDNSDQQILAVVGLEQLAQIDSPALQPVAYQRPAPVVAGAYTSKEQRKSGGLFDVLYEVLSQ